MQFVSGDYSADSRQIPEALQWCEGMLLAPQHLQQLAQRAEGLLYYHIKTAAPFVWGVRHLEVDRVLLAGGTFRVRALEAIMPDGLVVAYPVPSEAEARNGPNGAPDEARAWPELKLSRENLPVTIYLAVTARGPVATTGDFPRYHPVEGAPVVDESTGENELAVPRLRPALRLLALPPDKTPPAKFVSFPLAKVKAQGDSFAFDDFIPPVTTIASGDTGVSRAIWELCNFTAQVVRMRATDLASQANSRASASQPVLMLETRGRIQCLVSALPQFEALLTAGAAHPWELYKSFCLLAGSMAGLGDALVPPPFGPYNHNDLYAVFNELQKFVFQMMEQGIPENYFRIPLEPGHTDRQQVFFLRKFKREWQDRSLFLTMRGPSGMAEEELAAWGKKSCIASAGVMPSVQQKRIMGAARRHIESHESLVPPRGVMLFSLTNDPEFLKPDEELRVVNDVETSGKRCPSEIVLYVKKSLAEKTVPGNPDDHNSKAFLK
ncbi:MAG TPA: type VI secretion system baseplate subunit TssK [Candidatus Saccharimonadales bacterium]|nr:type VI secretion system baseplate subunit TssK [Candidatus Saccharimonadales bacterium]